MKYFLISICIPAFNACKHISETLESVRGQDYKSWELIVVEDGSDDGTQEIVEIFAKTVTQNVTYLRNENNLGLPATRNVAASFASGAWIAFLDSDDLWDTEHLNDLFKTSIHNPDSDIIHSGVKLFRDFKENVILEQSLSQEIIRQFPISIFNRTYGIQPSSVMLSKRIYEVTGGSNPRFRYAEDIEMWFRCARAGFKFAYSGNNTCYYRASGGLTSNSVNMTLDTAKVYEDNCNWDAIPKKTRTVIASNAWFAAAKMTRKGNKALSKKCLSKSIKQRFTIKHLLYWLLLRIPFPIFQ